MDDLRQSAGETELRATADEARAVRYAETMAAARRAGLMEDKEGRIAGRVSAELIARAKRCTGLSSDTELLEFALANVALEDNFVEVFRKARGKIDRDIQLGF